MQMWLLSRELPLQLGFMVDVGIVFVENMLRHFEMQDPRKNVKVRSAKPYI